MRHTATPTQAASPFIVVLRVVYDSGRRQVTPTLDPAPRSDLKLFRTHQMRYRVHEFAELAGVTVKALRHYDRLGLLKPQRSDAGYRIYTQRNLDRLEQIIALKFLGVPLKQIKAVLDRNELELSDALRMQR